MTEKRDVRLAIVGSTQLTRPEVESIIMAAIERYKPDVIISGAARGVDTIAVQIARELKIRVREFPASVQSWEGGFLPRNKKIVAACTHLLRIGLRGEFSHSSAWTRDAVRVLGKPTEEVVVKRR